MKKLIKLFYLHFSCNLVVEKSNKIKNNFPYKSGNPERHKI